MPKRRLRQRLTCGSKCEVEEGHRQMIGALPALALGFTLGTLLGVIAWIKRIRFVDGRLHLSRTTIQILGQTVLVYAACWGALALAFSLLLTQFR